MSGKMEPGKPRADGKPSQQPKAAMDAQPPPAPAVAAPAAAAGKAIEAPPSKEQLLQRERSDSEETEEEAEEPPVEAVVETKPAAALELKSISSKSSFDKCLKLAGDRLVVFFFTGNWCETCHLFKPYVIDLAQLNLDAVDFYEVNVDDSEDTAEACAIDHLPTFLLYKKEQKLAEVCDDSKVTLEAKITEFK